MTRLCLILLFILTTKQNNAQYFQWVSPLAGAGAQNVRSIALDAAGNTYIAGFFTGTVDLNPDSLATANHTSVGSTDIFIVKLDQQGNYRWSKSFGSTAADEGKAITVSASGAVYITGIFQLTMNADPGLTNTSLIALGSFDCFITKYDTSGNFSWARQLSGANSAEEPFSITTDAAENVYTLGNFGSTADFDPSNNSFLLSAAGGTDIFISKLTPNGNFVWAKNIGGIASESAGDIILDQHQRLIISGSFRNTVDFDLGLGVQSRTASGITSDNFILKLDTSSNYLWVATFGGTGTEQANGLTISSQNEVINCGFFGTTVDFNPGLGTAFLTATGVVDIYVLKLDSLGNYLWAKNIGGNQNQTAVSTCLDDSGNIYTGGWFKGAVDFDPGLSTFSLTSNGNEDAYVLKLDPLGNFKFAYHFGGSGFEIINGLEVNPINKFLIAGGQFNGTVDFDPSLNVRNITSLGSSEGFVMATGTHSGILPVTFYNFNGKLDGQRIWVNWATSMELNNKGFELQKSLDNEYFESIQFITGIGNSNKINQYTTSVSYEGPCYLRIKQIDKDGTSWASNVIFISNSLEETLITPNPGHNYWQIESNSMIDFIEIYDSIGNLVYQENSEQTFSQINIENFKTGLYIIYLSANKQVKKVKLMKQ